MNYLIKQNNLTQHLFSFGCVKPVEMSMLLTLFISSMITLLTKTIQYIIKNSKIIHTHLLKSDLLGSDIFYANTLLDWYSTTSSMESALKLFVTIPDPNVLSWNIMVSGYNNMCFFEDPWWFFHRIVSLGFETIY